MEPDNPFYNIYESVRLSGRLDQGALEKAFRQVVERHEVLSTTFADIDGTRSMVHVHRGKGAKDRYVILPSVTLERLRRYADLG